MKPKNKKINKEITIAVLGPANSYSEEVTTKNFPDSNLIYCDSISKVIELVFSKKNYFGLIPIENLLHGPVTEVLDSLTSYYINNSSETKKPEILLSLTLPVTHYLGLPEHLSSIELSQIEEIYSHPQALFQSREFIDLHLPQAEKKGVSSTSLAPLLALKSPKKSAAIASKNALLASSFAIKGETVSDIKKNQTRFALLGWTSEKINISEKTSELSKNYPLKTSICIHPGKDRKGLLLDLLDIISEKNKCNLLSIHSRPDEHGGFIFYFDIEGDKSLNPVSKCIKDLKDYCSSKTASISQVLVFGSYPSPPFIEPAIKKICLVGSEGNMGKWLNNFFTSKDLEVLPIDIDSTNKEKQLIKNCDVVFFSIPMRETDNISNSLFPFISPGTLIVENCSVKSKSLSQIESIFKDNFEIMGVHTMFGPSATDIFNQNVIITKTDQSGHKSQAFEDFLYKHGAIIHHSNIEDHDKIVSILQALCQFSSLAIGHTLDSYINDKHSIKHFLTPNSSRILTSSKNVFEQSETLTYDLQKDNPFAEEVRQNFIKYLQELNELLNNQKKFEEDLNTSKNSILPILKKLTE